MLTICFDLIINEIEYLAAGKYIRQGKLGKKSNGALEEAARRGSFNEIDMWPNKKLCRGAVHFAN